MISVPIDEPAVTLMREELKSVATAVRDAIAQIDAEPSRGLKTLFPAMWCEYASIVLAEVLGARGLGSWTFVEHGHFEGPNGHTWIELRDQTGKSLWTIDVTIDQFSWGGDAPFVGKERTPAAGVFTKVRFEGNWNEWPVLKWNPSYRAYLDAFAEKSGLL